MRGLNQPLIFMAFLEFWRLVPNVQMQQFETAHKWSTYNETLAEFSARGMILDMYKRSY